MKTFPYFNLALLAILFVSGSFMTSCSSSSDDDDDDVVTLNTPAYEKEAAKYVISSTGSAYKSIELTASGEYIVIPTTSQYAVKSMRLAETNVIFPKYQDWVTRANTNSIIYGKFTKIGDSEYRLDGFGTIKIQKTNDTAYSLSITPSEGTPYTLTAAKKNTKEDSSMTNYLCRSWKFDRMRFQLTFGGRTLDKTVSFDNQYDLYVAVAQTWPEMMEGEMMSKDEFEKSGKQLFESNPPQRVVFTKSGTYMVEYKQNVLAVATWVWEDEANGVLRYSWNYKNMYDTYMAGIVDVKFSGSTLSIRERNLQDEDGMNIGLTWYLIEVK